MPETNPNDEARRAELRNDAIDPAFSVINSSFVIRHSSFL
jgi:hypothetical protein